MKPYANYTGHTRQLLRKLYDRHPDSQMIYNRSIDHYRRLNADGWISFTGPRSVKITNDGLCELSEELK